MNNTVENRITMQGRDGAFGAYMARPMTLPAPAVVVLQEVFGVNADIRKTCDELAEQGFLAAAPELFWRQEPGVNLNHWSDAEWKTTRASSRGDLPEQEQKLVWATQGVPKPDLFEAKAGGTAWKSKPSWYIVGKKDQTVHPDLERAMAKRMGATTYEVDSSHVPMLSQPQFVLDVIRTAAKSVKATG